jgi:FAD/FMN-containing dehydrogenase
MALGESALGAHHSFRQYPPAAPHPTREAPSMASLHLPDFRSAPKPAPASVGELAASIRGRMMAPGDVGWDVARQAWNLAVDQRPAFVVLPLNRDDVRTTVKYARRHGLRIAPQATGHSAGALGSLADTILLSTRHMRGVKVDASRRIARVQAGTVWQEVTKATSSFRLYSLSGSSPNVGVVGYTLGGGLSWLARQHGLAANHVTAIEVVTPDGGLARATDSAHDDLFWALRGGGGNFGVVTAVEFELFSYREIYAGMFVWPFERHVDILHSWYEWTRTAPDAVTTALRIMHLPMADGLPPFLSGRSVVVVDGAFAGGVEAGRRAVAALRSLAPEVDTWGLASPLALSRLHMDPEEPVPFAGDSFLLGEIDSAGLDRIAAAVRPPLLVGELRHLGGALSRVEPGAGALPSLRGDYSVLGGGVVADASRVVDAALGRLRAATAEYQTGALYPNFTEHPADSSRFYTAADYARLQRIRASVDPHELIVSSHPISLSQEQS